MRLSVLITFLMSFSFFNGYAQMEVKNSANEVLLYVTEMGNVGVGSTSPEAKLLVKRADTDSIAFFSTSNDQTKLGIKIDMDYSPQSTRSTMGLRVKNMANASYLLTDPIGIINTGSLPDLPIDGGRSSLNQENILFDNGNGMISNYINFATRQLDNRIEGNLNVLTSNYLLNQEYPVQKAVTGILEHNDNMTRFNLSEGNLGYYVKTDASAELDELYGVRGVVRKPEMIISGESRSAAVLGFTDDGVTTDPPPIWQGYFTGAKSYFSHAVGIHTPFPNTGLMLDSYSRIRCESVSEYADENLKTDVETITDALQTVTLLRGVRFKWNIEGLGKSFTNTDTQIGLIAQEVEPVLPEIVHTGDQGDKSLAYEKLVAVLIEAVKDLDTKVTELETKIPENSQ